MDTRQLLRGALFACAAIGVAACGEDLERPISFNEAMQLICESPRQVAAETTCAETTCAEPTCAETPANKAAAASRWIAARLRNREARAWYAGLASLPPQAKAQQVRAAALRAGLARCPLAEIWALPPAERGVPAH